MELLDFAYFPIYYWPNSDKLTWYTFSLSHCPSSWLLTIAVQFNSVAQLYLTLCNSMGCSTSAFPVDLKLLEFTQIHVHWVSDAIQPSHPLLSLSPPTFNLSQHWGLFQWVNFFASGGRSVGVSTLASVLPMNTQDWSPLEWTGWISLQSKGLSRVFNMTVQKKSTILQYICPFSLDSGLRYIPLGLWGFFSMDDSCPSAATFCTCRFTCLPYSYSFLKWSYSEHLLYYPKYSVSLLL